MLDVVRCVHTLSEKKIQKVRAKISLILSSETLSRELALYGQGTFKNNKNGASKKEAWKSINLIVKSRGQILATSYYVCVLKQVTQPH